MPISAGLAAASEFRRQYNRQAQYRARHGRGYNRPGLRGSTRTSYQSGRHGRSKTPYIGSKTKKLVKKVQSIEARLKASDASQTHRFITAGKIQGVINANASGLRGTFNIGNLETALTNLRYYDPGTNTLTTNNAVSATYTRKFYIESSSVKVRTRNNYGVPVDVTVYHCRPKGSTTVSPDSAWANGWVD